MASLRSHPRYGASWEGFAIEQVLAMLGSDNAYFWSTQRGAELDLLLFRDGMRWGFEFKCSDAPSMTKSMHIALHDLFLKGLFVVYCIFRLIPATHSAPFRPPIPEHSGHLFRNISATL